MEGISMKPLALILFTSILAACGGSTNKCDTANITASCTATSSSTCFDYTGLSSSDATSIQNQCQNSHNTYGGSACSATNRVGTCSVPDSTPGSNLLCGTGTFSIRYYSPTFSTSTAQSACTAFQGASFTSG
jgi:hypothetical protein